MLKKYFIFIFISFISFYGFSQSIAYQTTIKKTGNVLVTNQNVTIRVSILQNSINGQNVYTEIQHIKTNANGLASFLISEGNVVSGNYSQINWGTGMYFIKTETDPENGTNYTMVHSQQILSVPYTLYTQKSKNPGPKGKDGLSVTDAKIINDSLWLSLSDNDKKNAGIILKNPNITVKNAQIKNDTLYTDFTDKSIKKTPIIRNIGKHYIGEYFGGGMVYYVYDDSIGNQHGLIISLKNLSDSIEWSNVKDTIGFLSFWNGKTNTSKIISQSGHQNSAALLCDTFTGGGYTDWYLPSENELALLKTCKLELFKNFTGNPNIIDLYKKSYWTSTVHQVENFINYEDAVYFLNIYTAHNNKNNSFAVRAIRSF